MSFNYYLLDVFTDQVFGGNQLAVFPDAKGINPDDFQNIARELNLSETVFVERSENGKNHSMRIFTPASELPTAGHPTIGTAYLLARETGAKEITLNQKVGPIETEVSFLNNEPDMITMKQLLPKFGSVFNDREAIAKVLSLDPGDIDDDHPIQVISCGNDVLLIPIKNTVALKRVNIQPHLLGELNQKVEASLVYCFSVNGVEGGDVQGRMFAPLLGIYEDPATGSANGPLACYLVRYGLVKMPALSLQGYEMGRPSKLYLDVKTGDNNEINEVKVGGKCRLVGKGELFLSH